MMFVMKKTYTIALAGLELTYIRRRKHTEILSSNLYNPEMMYSSLDASALKSPTLTLTSVCYFFKIHLTVRQEGDANLDGWS